MIFILLALSLPFLPVALLEIGLRIVTGCPTGFYLGMHVAEDYRNGLTGYRRGEPFMMSPFVRGGYEINPNNLGLRPTFPGQIIESEKRGKLRIFCVGDSWTDSFNVADADTYPAHLQRILDERAPGRYEVINTAFGGGSMAKHLSRLRGLSYLKPNLVLLGFCPNDLGDDLEWDHLRQDPLQTNPLKLRRGKMIWLESFFRTYTAIGEWTIRRQAAQIAAKKEAKYDLNMSWQEKLTVYREALKRIENMVYGDNFNEHYQSRFEIYARIWKEFKAVSERDGASLLVWSTPEFDEVFDRACPRTYVGRLEALCRTNAVPFVDIVPAFRRSIERDPAVNLYDWAPVDFHPGRHGYRVIAETLADRILSADAQ